MIQLLEIFKPKIQMLSDNKSKFSSNFQIYLLKFLKNYLSIMKKIKKNESLNLSFEEGHNSINKNDQFDHFGDENEKNNLVLFPDDAFINAKHPDQQDLLDFDIGTSKSKSHMNLMGRDKNLINTFNLDEFGDQNKSKSNVKLPPQKRISLQVNQSNSIIKSKRIAKKLNDL